MVYVGVLLGLLFYIYGVMAVFLFGHNDPLHFGTLHLSMLSLFGIVTLEGWTDIMMINIHGCDHPMYGYGPELGCTNPQGMGVWAAIFFISFVLIGTMIVLNLFIGVIMNSMDEVRNEQDLEQRLARQAKGESLLEDDIKDIHTQLDTIRHQLDLIAYRLRKQDASNSKIKELN